MSVQESASTELDNCVVGYGMSYSITSILSALLVVLKESNESVHNFLVAMTGHHWASHGLINIVIFLVLGYIFSKRDQDMSQSSLIKMVVVSTVISGLIIVGYFI